MSEVLFDGALVVIKTDNRIVLNILSSDQALFSIECDDDPNAKRLLLTAGALAIGEKYLGLNNTITSTYPWEMPEKSEDADEMMDTTQ